MLRMALKNVADDMIICHKKTGITYEMTKKRGARRPAFHTMFNIY